MDSILVRRLLLVVCFVKIQTLHIFFQLIFVLNKKRCGMRLTTEIFHKVPTKVMKQY